MKDFDPQQFIIQMAVLILAITIHEFSHAITADKLGDPTPRSQGRISLFPTDHLDPLGTLMMLITAYTGYGIGWGRPVMTNPRNFEHPVRGSALVAIAGPISNILQAIVFAGLYRLMPNLSDSVQTLFILGVYINLSLALFNMIPIGPLDGHWVIQAILPRDLSMQYERLNRAYGSMVFIGLVLMAPGVLRSLISPSVLSMAKILIGS